MAKKFHGIAIADEDYKKVVAEKKRTDLPIWKILQLALEIYFERNRR